MGGDMYSSVVGTDNTAGKYLVGGAIAHGLDPEGILVIFVEKGDISNSQYTLMEEYINRMHT